MEAFSSAASVSRPLRLWLATSAAATFAVGFLLFSSQRSVAEGGPAQPAAVPAVVATVERAELSAWELHSGRLEAIERVEVRSRVSGVVTAVHFREGALVREGARLYTIDPAPYRAEFDRSQAELLAAKARADHAIRELARARRLLDENAIATREHDERLRAAQEAEASLMAARAAADSARLNLEYTEVRAPVSGRVGRNEVTAGNVIAAGAEAPVLTRLVSGHPIGVVCYLTAMPVFWGCLTPRLVASAAAATIALVNSLANIASAVGPAVMGPVKQNYGLGPGIAVLGLCLTLSALFALSLRESN